MTVYIIFPSPGFMVTGWVSNRESPQSLTQSTFTTLGRRASDYTDIVYSYKILFFFLTKAEYSYFSADLRLKILL